MWLVFAVGSAVFAALTPIPTKIGIDCFALVNKLKQGETRMTEQPGRWSCVYASSRISERFPFSH